MDLLSFALAFGSGFIIAWTLKRPLKQQRTIRNPDTQEKHYEVAANHQRTQAKTKRKQQIIDCIDMNGQIKSREVEDMFGVSSATATRYLSELAREGKIKKQGQGRGVHYTL
ncbi:MAG: FaeA/PapI family transcriptional regulator [Candidatus Saccharimonadales bacterium]